MIVRHDETPKVKGWRVANTEELGERFSSVVTRHHRVAPVGRPASCFINSATMAIVSKHFPV
jgi:hypothetical protein